MPATPIPADHALLAFSLGPVQPFIAAARTLRDLWAGSYLLAWLTASAMKPVAKAGGRFILPAVTDNPLFLRATGQAVPARWRDSTTPCLPNRFDALIPDGQAIEIIEKCTTSCQHAWAEINAAACRAFAGMMPTEPKINYKWQEAWKQQVEDYFDIRVTVLRSEHVAGLSVEDALDRLNRLAAAGRSVRHIPKYTAVADGRRYPVKCSLLGSYEQIGPATLDDAAKFWKAIAERSHRGTRVGARERLCAVSLTKRFAWPAYFAVPQRTGWDVRDLRYSDTATVAASQWLQAPKTPDADPALEIRPNDFFDNDRGWSGQWLHWQDAKQDPDDPCPPKVWDKLAPILQKKRETQGPIPTYYAILMLDGDGMGKLLRAHGADAVTEKLGKFGLENVERIVGRHDGETIYAGGDDVLALLPTASALACANELNRIYREILGIPKATASAGIAVVHYKEDLRFALQSARRAEKAAKDAGRDALAVTVCRRSGEHTTATLDWTLAPAFQNLVDLFREGLSDRWAYQLRSELPTLTAALGGETDALPWAAAESEFKRLLGRSEVPPKLKQRLNDLALMTRLTEYRDNARERLENHLAETPFSAKDAADKRRLAAGVALAGFVTLCQSASFLARGRDV